MLTRERDQLQAEIAALQDTLARAQLSCARLGAACGELLEALDAMPLSWFSGSPTAVVRLSEARRAVRQALSHMVEADR
jgi:hypothetical protein